MNSRPSSQGLQENFYSAEDTKEQRWVPFKEALAEARQHTAGPEPDTTDADRLRAAIIALPDRYREVVALCDLEGHCYEEAAARLECAVGAVRSRLHRAVVCWPENCSNRSLNCRGVKHE